MKTTLLVVVAVLSYVCAVCGVPVKSKLPSTTAKKEDHQDVVLTTSQHFLHSPELDKLSDEDYSEYVNPYLNNKTMALLPDSIFVPICPVGHVWDSDAQSCRPEA